MRQVLIAAGRVLVTDLPDPAPGADDLLVEVHWSCISPGTELAALAPVAAPGAGGAASGGAATSIGRQAARAVRLGFKAVAQPARALELGRNLLLNRRAGQALAKHLQDGTALADLADGAAHDPRGPLGLAPGYSCAGVVRAVGERVRGFVPGDRVACAGAGRACHAELVSVPAGLAVPVPAGIDLRWASLGTLGAIALQGVRRADLRLGECAVVLGLGLVGQLCLALLGASGVRRLACDPNAKRAEQAGALGLAEAVGDPGDLARRLREATASVGADAVLVAAHSRSEAPLRQAVELARRRGRVVVVGDVPITVDRAPFYAKELDLLISCSYGPGRHDPEYEEAGRDYPVSQVRWTARRNLSCFLELAASGTLALERLTLSEHDLDDAPAAYAALAGGEVERPLGALLRMPAAGGGNPARPRRDGPALPAAAELPAGLALVGAGAFARGMLLPQLRQHADLVQWRAVISARGAEARNLAIAEGIPACYAELDEGLRDPAVRGVVIASRHQHHGAQVVACLAADRAVFCEKPLCLTWEELEAIEQAADRQGGRPPLLVGFNRRFAPATAALRNGLAGRKGPALLTYRMNAGHLPTNHWLHQAGSGGRNLGEACHAYDLIAHLVGAEPVAVSAQAITPREHHARADENFAATLRFADGSLATLLYCALGDPAAGKERLEIHADACTWVLDDWRELTRWADGRAHSAWRHEGAGPPDKGHGRELELAAAMLAGKAESPIPWPELRRASAVALWVQDCLEGRISGAILGAPTESGPCAAS